MPFPKPKIEQPPPSVPDATGDSTATQGEPGDGTQQSGYVRPDLGPFQCQNCTHFQAPTTCDHPTVVNDPEIGGQVEAEGCCNYFKSAGQTTGEEEISTDSAENGAPAIGVAEEQ